MCGFCLVLKDRKGSLIGESDVITLYCQPFQRICDLFLSFNTNQKPRIKSPKSGDFENKIYIGRSPDPFSSRPNTKEEKVVWLHETIFNIQMPILLTSKMATFDCSRDLITSVQYLYNIVCVTMWSLVTYSNCLVIY